MLMPRIRPLLPVAAALLLVAGCSGGDDGKTSATGPRGGESLEKVVYVTGAGLFGRESYVYEAIDKGYFRAAGLDVEVQSGKGTEADLKLLSAGAAQYAVLDLAGAIVAYGKENLRDFTVVGGIQQRSPAAFMSLASKNITRPKDLEGTRVGAQEGAITSLLFPAYAKLAGFDAGKVRVQPMAPQLLPGALAAGEVDAISQLTVGKPAVANAAQGREINVLPFSDVMTDLFGDVLAVSRTTAQGKPDQVRRFTTAMLRGLQDAIENPQQAGEAYARYQKAQSAKVAAAEMALMKPYVDLGPGLGQIDEARATRTVALLQGAGTIPAGFTPADIISFDLIPRPGA
jgi:NitT/TauT family transport system substrate-binding protein